MPRKKGAAVDEVWVFGRDALPAAWASLQCDGRAPTQSSSLYSPEAMYDRLRDPMPMAGSRRVGCGERAVHVPQGQADSKMMDDQQGGEPLGVVQFNAYMQAYLAKHPGSHHFQVTLQFGKGVEKRVCFDSDAWRPKPLLIPSPRKRAMPSKQGDYIKKQRVAHGKGKGKGMAQKPSPHQKRQAGSSQDLPCSAAGFFSLSQACSEEPLTKPDLLARGQQFMLVLSSALEHPFDFKAFMAWFLDVFEYAMQEGKADAGLTLVDWAEYSLLDYLRGCMARLIPSAPARSCGESLTAVAEVLRKRLPGRFACSLAAEQLMRFLSGRSFFPLGTGTLAYMDASWDKVFGFESFRSIWRPILKSLKDSLEALRGDLLMGKDWGARAWCRREVAGLPGVPPSGFDDPQIVCDSVYYGNPPLGQHPPCDRLDHETMERRSTGCA
jgi:hypothetical protein